MVGGYQLEKNEMGCSIVSCSFADNAGVYYVVGTAFAMPDEAEPTKGRILVFQVRQWKLRMGVEHSSLPYWINAILFLCIDGCTFGLMSVLRVGERGCMDGPPCPPPSRLLPRCISWFACLSLPLSLEVLLD